MNHQCVTCRKCLSRRERGRPLINHAIHKSTKLVKNAQNMLYWVEHEFRSNDFLKCNLHLFYKKNKKLKRICNARVGTFLRAPPSPPITSLLRTSFCWSAQIWRIPNLRGWLMKNFQKSNSRKIFSFAKSHFKHQNN